MPTWSAPISLKGVKGDSTPQTLPNDLTPNSVNVSPVSGDTAASQLSVTSSTGSSLFKADGSGNVSVAGTLSAAGASSFAAVAASSSAIAGNETVGGTLSVTGATTLGSLTASTASVSGNESVGGNLTVTGTLTAGSITGSSTNIAGSQQVQGNDTITGNLSVGGTSSLQGAVTCGSDLTATAGNTKLGPLSCTTLNASGAASFATSVAVTGTITPGAVNCQNNTNVGKNLVVSGTTQTVGLLTASGNVTTPALNVSSGGTSVLGTATADALTTSGNLRINGTATLQAVSAASLTTSGNFRSNGDLSCTSGTTTLGGPVNIAGTTTMAALTASSASTSGNVSVGGTLGVTGATTLASTTTGALTASSASVANGATVGGTLQAKSVTLTSGAGGSLTFADGTTMSTAASGGGSSSSAPAKSTVAMGVYWNTAASANSYYQTNFVVQNANSSTNIGVTPAQFRFDTPGSVTAYSLCEAGVASGTHYVQLYKNGSAFGTAINAGTGTLNAMAGGTFPATTYAYAAGDTLAAYVMNTAGGNVQYSIYLGIQWQGGSGSGTTNDPSYNSITVAPVSGSTTPSLITTPSLTLTSGGGGKLTFADGTSQTTSASAAAPGRTAIDMGGFSYGTNSSGTYWTSKKYNTNAGANSTAVNYQDDFAIRMPWPGSVVGFSIFQGISNAGSTSIMYNKNGTNLTPVTNVGSGAGQFMGTHAVGTYPFVAGDVFKFTHAYSGTGATDVYTTMYVQWSA